MSFKEKLTRELRKQIHQEILLNIPPSEKFGDYSLHCFNSNPEEIKKKISSSLIEKIEIKGSYLNIFINKEKFIQETLKEIKRDYGKNNIGNKEKIMIEFSQPNTHKEFHLGHLRNVCLGDSLVRLYKFNNYKVLSINYIGDIGAHVAKCLWNYLKFHKKDKIPENKGKFLGELYTESMIKLEENENYKEEISKILQKLENKDKELTELWKKTRQWSINEFKQIYKELNVTFDYYFYESEVEKQGKKIVNELLKKKIAKIDQGAILVDLNKHNLGIFLLLKSDGTSLYSTKDLALAILKFNKYKIKKSIYIVDSRQSTYFKQLFKTLEIMGFKKEMYHLPYEFVNFEGKPISSREGNLILYEDFRDTTLKKVIEETKKRNPKLFKNKIEEISKEILFGAIKFEMLKYDTKRIINFKTKEALSFEGETGSYIQYTHARICSILKKSKLSNKVRYNNFNKEEFTLIKKLSEFPEIIKDSAIKYKPNLLCNYLIQLSQIFNNYYSKHEIKSSKERLFLAYRIKQVIDTGLNLLGIESPEVM